MGFKVSPTQTSLGFCETTHLRTPEGKSRGRVPHTYPPSPEVWGLTMPAQRAEAMAASTEEPCRANTSVPSAVQRPASVTTAPRWNSCRTREGCAGQCCCCCCPHLHPPMCHLKPGASNEAVANPTNASGDRTSLGTSPLQAAAGSHGHQFRQLSTLCVPSWGPHKPRAVPVLQPGSHWEWGYRCKECSMPPGPQLALILVPMLC